jgi:hypothetical protein
MRYRLAMPSFPSREQINKAFDLTIVRLRDHQPTAIESTLPFEKGGSGRISKITTFANPLLSKDTVAVFLKYLLLQGLETSETNSWRERWKQDKNIPLRVRLKDLLLDIQGWVNTATEFHLPTLLDQHLSALLLPHYCLHHERILDLAMEAVLSEPLAPEICLKFSPTTEEELSVTLPGSWQHAIIFAAPYFFSHEFYPLAVDAYVHDAELYGEPRSNVLGAHIDWLTDEGNLKRILYLDFAENRLVETDLAEPIRPDSLQFLCLGSQEQTIHQALSQRFSCLQLNPFPAFSLADDKAATLAGWAAMGLEVPNFQELGVGDIETALVFLEHFAEIVVKPNRATEGELVAYFQGDNPESRLRLENHLQRCWQQGAAIVQERRDGVCYRNPETGTLHSLALRFNIAGNAENKHFLESGYGQLGTDLQHPAACSRAGRIVGFDQVLANLCPRTVDPNQEVSLDTEIWSFLRQLAEQAASLFPNLRLLGLDVLLDLNDSGKIIPVFLEANPRPAGLCHSRLFAENLFQPAEIGVSLRLWDNLNA